MWLGHLQVGEEQRRIEGWYGYCVSSLGRVFSFKRQGWQCSVVHFNREPYVLAPIVSLVGRKPGRKVLIVSLKEGRAGAKAYTIASLVAAAFIGPKPSGMGVLHWDDDYTNNRLSNLRYGTQLENAADARRNGKRRGPMVGCKRAVGRPRKVG